MYYCTNVILHGEKYGKEKDNLIPREIQASTCDLGERWYDAIIACLGVIVETANCRSLHPNELRRKDLEKVSRVGRDSGLVSKLDGGMR
jgi:hypothetical protein